LHYWSGLKTRKWQKVVNDWSLDIGAQPESYGTQFRVWTTNRQRVDVMLFAEDGAIRIEELQPESDAPGYFSGHIKGILPGARYKYRLDGGVAFPDPASRSQPDGVHGPSHVVDLTTFAWTDAGWSGISLADLVIYELHVGTATPEGTFDALIGRLDAIRALGATAIELMPVADFPGERNWGYDGVCLFAPARAYGGAEALLRLVDAAHACGLGVILDVMYNHLGPSGNYLREFSPAYFTDRHKTAWGDALNFDGPNSEPVRAFFLANACSWAREYHLDGLRLDATHAILDDSPTHILAEIASRVRDVLPAGRHFLLIAENENNEPRLVRPPEDGGFGLDAVWADDFHHQVRVALAGDRDGYYQDYGGSVADLVTTLRHGWFYTGQRSPYLGRPRGAPAGDVPPPHFVYCIQNHDQVGNRALGDRLNYSISPEAYRAASTLLLLSPYTPLLFMGQEWGASTPFLYFTDHDAELGRLVTEGRRAEFAGFTAFTSTEVPDPQDPATFLRSTLRWGERDAEPHAGLLRLYHELLELRGRLLAPRARDRESFAVTALNEAALALRWTGSAGAAPLLLVVNLRGVLSLNLADRMETTPPAGQQWSIVFSSQDARYGGRSADCRLEQGQLMTIDGPAALLLG
jgi:maltooligosyltrehalose trehalohydrolase